MPSQTFPQALTRSAAAAIVLLVPSVLAFFTAGYFDGPRDWAGVAVWVAVLLGALGGARFPRARSATVAISGLGLLAAWTLLSIFWAPVAGSAYHAGQIVMLYLGALIASALALRGRVLRWVEPALAAGSMIVIGYGLSNRLLPGLLHFAMSPGADGRLEQPLTYWNAMGELAALGFVLSVRLAGDHSRPDWMRGFAMAIVAPLGMALYISFSRGALFACLAGLVTLAAIAPGRSQLRSIGLGVVTGGVSAAASAPFGGVTSLSGSLSTREGQGAIVLALLVVVALIAVTLRTQLERRGRRGELRLPRRAPLIAAAVIIAGFAMAVVLGASESSGTAQLVGANRLASLQSNRYGYWSVAIRAFASDPVHGVGAGGWSVDWLRWRHVTEFVRDAHSLELQTLAELGIIGAAFLATFLLGLAGAARRGLARARSPAAGMVAGLVVYLGHSPLDWDWQMPAVTLVALVLGGAVIAIGQADGHVGAVAAAAPVSSDVEPSVVA